MFLTSGRLDECISSCDEIKAMSINNTAHSPSQVPFPQESTDVEISTVEEDLADLVRKIESGWSTNPHTDSTENSSEPKNSQA